MRDAVSGTLMIKLMMVFLIILISFVAVAYEYAKAFKVKNVIIDYIEMYEGYNDLSIRSINNYLDNSFIHYNVPIEDNQGHYRSNHPNAYCSDRGYCIEMVEYESEVIEIDGEEISDGSPQTRRVGCIVTTFIPINLFGIGDMLSLYRFKIPSLAVSSEVQIYDPYWHNEY